MFYPLSSILFDEMFLFLRDISGKNPARSKEPNVFFKIVKKSTVRANRLYRGPRLCNLYIKRREETVFCGSLLKTMLPPPKFVPRTKYIVPTVASLLDYPLLVKAMVNFPSAMNAIITTLFIL